MSPALRVAASIADICAPWKLALFSSIAFRTWTARLRGNSSMRMSLSSGSAS